MTPAPFLVGAEPPAGPDRRLSAVDWARAAVEALRTPLPRPTADEHCPTCGAATPVGLAGTWHLCRGDVVSAVKAFGHLISGVVGNF